MKFTNEELETIELALLEAIHDYNAILARKGVDEEWAFEVFQPRLEQSQRLLYRIKRRQ